MPEVVDLPEKHLFQAYGITLLENKHPIVRKLKKSFQPSVHGHKTWPSSFLLMDYLLHNSLLADDGNVLELGCGWGPTSIFCAKHTQGSVTGLDMDQAVFPFLEAQATLNAVEIMPLTRRFEALRKKELSRYNLLLGADICFWDELADTHFKLFHRALKAGVGDILLADPGRAPFLALADRCKAVFNSECKTWYCTEPTLFEGYILHIRQR